jgi:hypothetical protein
MNSIASPVSGGQIRPFPPALQSFLRVVSARAFSAIPTSQSPVAHGFNEAYSNLLHVGYAMTTIEKSVKAQFSKIFGMNNWVIFKRLAESNLEDATKVKGKDLPIERQFRLLARNSRKRLLLGVGVELLLKSIYLKQG